MCVGVGGCYKLWNETMKRSMRHSLAPPSENKPGGDVHNNDGNNKLVGLLISEVRAKEGADTSRRLQQLISQLGGFSYLHLSKLT